MKNETVMTPKARFITFHMEETLCKKKKNLPILSRVLVTKGSNPSMSQD